jgi:hypothetical protein
MWERLKRSPRTSIEVERQLLDDNDQIPMTNDQEVFYLGHWSLGFGHFHLHIPPFAGFFPALPFG